MTKSNLLVLLLIFNVLCLFGQSRQELEKKKKQNEQDILLTNELITKTEINKKNSYTKLLLINSKIKQREELISGIGNEINNLDVTIQQQQELILALNSDLEKLKREYATIIYYSYKNRNNYQRLMFVLAAKDVNTGFKRLKYLQQYSKYRTQQVKQIIETKEKISNELNELEKIKTNKSDLLRDKKVEASILSKEKVEQNLVIKKLESEHVDLKRKLNSQVKQANVLQKEIERIIAEEVKIANEKNKKKASSFFQLTPEEQKLADVFVNNKSKLPWPTDRGIITSYFGEHPHPILKGVVVRNDGIDISTYEGTDVRSIFDGVVSRVFVLNGAHTTIIIRHGNYLSVYSNLTNVVVKQGDKVKTKQILGKVYTDKEDDNKTILQFQIWHESEKMDPKEWIAKERDE
jgi:murein hydrolase activator